MNWNSLTVAIVISLCVSVFLLLYATNLSNIHKMADFVRLLLILPLALILIGPLVLHSKLIDAFEMEVMNPYSIMTVMYLPGLVLFALVAVLSLRH